MSIKILITDPISEKGINLLKVEGFKIIYKPDIKKEKYSHLQTFQIKWTCE